jgi:hypothetical protein
LLDQEKSHCVNVEGSFYQYIFSIYYQKMVNQLILKNPPASEFLLQNNLNLPAEKFAPKKSKILIIKSKICHQNQQLQNTSCLKHPSNRNLETTCHSNQAKTLNPTTPTFPSISFLHHLYSLLGVPLLMIRAHRQVGEAATRKCHAVSYGVCSKTPLTS